MKKLILFAILSMTSSLGVIAQYRPYHQEDIKKYKKSSVKSFRIHVSPYSNGLRGPYRPQQFQGLQVISMNRSGGTHNDVYFIDKHGNTQYHTIRPRVPLNTQSHQHAVHDSSNPSGYQSFGHAILDGAASMLSSMLKD